MRVRLCHRPVGELARAAGGRAEEGGLLGINKTGLPDVGVQIGLKVVVAGHLVTLAAFLVQSHPGAPALHIVTFNPHLHRGADAREGVDHQPDQRPVAQVDRRADID